MQDAAREALIQACQWAGLHATDAVGAGGRVAIEGVSVGVLGRAVAHPLPPQISPMVVVADQVGAPTRSALTAAGVGWLDRRGHLSLPMLSAPVVVAVAPLPRQQHEAIDVDAFGRGRATVEVAADLVLAPDAPSGVRALAEEVGLSPSAISMARRRLMDAFLIAPDHRPVLPELFEALAAAWRPQWNPLHALPNPGPGWVVAGDRAAARVGAPVAVGRDAPHRFYVATPADVRVARRRYGDEPAATASRWVAVAPSRLAVTRAQPASDSEPPGAGHLVAPPAVLALELARDPGRGSEILRTWQLQGPFPWQARG
jgi:hypothetical protein